MAAYKGAFVLNSVISKICCNCENSKIQLATTIVPRGHLVDKEGVLIRDERRKQKIYNSR